MAEQSSVKTFRSKMFTTPPVRAVFPDLNKPDKFGAYKIGVDVLDNLELRQAFEQQADETIREAQVKLETKKKPSNSIFKQGEYKEVPFERIQFKMKEEVTRKGKKIKQKPRLVDSQKQPMAEVVFGGSLVKIAYYFQYSITPTGTFITPKLNAVQVLEHVGPGGEASIDSMFDTEEGYVSQGSTAAAVDDEGGAVGSEDARDY